MVPLDIATPDGTGFLKSQFRVEFSIILGGSSFCCEQISAQGATAAHNVAPDRERQRKVTQI
jgi:hypothetical protein